VLLRPLFMCRGQRREETFENVLRNPLTFPSKPAISPEAQDLIGKLLIKDPLQRLGTQVRLSGLHSCFQALRAMPV
jgi:hypothetical protein